MFTIYANGQPLHHPNLELEGRIVPAASLHEEINTQGSLDFTLEPNNPMYGIGSGTPIQVRFTHKTGTWRPVWNGRIATVEQTLWGTQSVHCEGKLAFLCDSFIEPFTYRGTVSGFLQALITKHNMAVNDAARALSVGSVTVTDPNGSIYRHKESSQSVWDAIQEHLIGSNLGGYLLLDPATDEVGYYASYTHVCSQPVRFGRNLLECVQTDDNTGIVNVLYAFGAQYNPAQETEPTGSGFNVWYGNRLHLTGNDFPLVHQASVNKYGRRCGTVVFDDITEAANLKRATQAELDKNYSKAQERRIEVKAIDMSIADRELEEITVGALVPVIPPNLWALEENDFNNAVQLMCVARELDLIDPSKSVYSFGTVQATMSALVGGA